LLLKPWKSRTRNLSGACPDGVSGKGVAGIS
jgi:hypothetical protein